MIELYFTNPENRVFNEAKQKTIRFIKENYDKEKAELLISKIRARRNKASNFMEMVAETVDKEDVERLIDTFTPEVRDEVIKRLESFNINDII